MHMRHSENPDIRAAMDNIKFANSILNEKPVQDLNGVSTHIIAMEIKKQAEESLAYIETCA